MSKFACYTDGACSLARNKGGIGVVFVKDGEKVYEFKKSYTNTTLFNSAMLQHPYNYF